MKKLKIIYEDKELLVINKEAKLLTISTKKEKDRTLYNEASSYVKKQNPKNKIFIVHRLDKETSGIVIFAKNETIKHQLQNNWDKLAKEREYIAIVEGRLENKGTIKNYLFETKTLQVFSTDDPKRGKLAITNYESLISTKAYSMLKINILTGRKNQIRVHMADLNHPIIGDKKYNAKSNPLGRLGLHATKLVLIHPKTKKEMIFSCDVPKEFNNIFKSLMTFFKTMI
ncbi:MAG: RluA family pseudouridine synthase [Bacilli bacterium]